MCVCVLGVILGVVSSLCFVSFSCLTDLPTRWGSSYQDRMYSTAKNIMCSEISTKGEGSVTFFLFLLHSCFYQWLSLFEFSKVISFLLCDIFSLFWTNWHVGKHTASFKRIFQEASPRPPSQQTAHAEAIVRIWHSAIGENGTCHLLQGLLWKFVFSLYPKSARFIFLSLQHSHSSLPSLSCSDREDQLLERRTA